MKHEIRDALNNASQQASATAAMAVIDRLQVQYRPAEQIVGVAATFLLLCERFGVTAQDAFTITKNVMNDANNRLIPEFRAVRQYVQEEL